MPLIQAKCSSANHRVNSTSTRPKNRGDAYDITDPGDRLDRLQEHWIAPQERCQALPEAPEILELNADVPGNG
jgi:hypothetical protein